MNRILALQALASERLTEDGAEDSDISKGCSSNSWMYC